MSDATIHLITTNLLFPTLIIFSVIVGYIFGVRPALKQNPTFAHFYSHEDSFFNAVAAKFSGVKQKLLTVLVSVAGFVVIAHDSLLSLMTAAGFDPVAYGTQLLPKVPPLAWPLITMAILWLVRYFRSLADRQAVANATALLNAGQPLAAPAPGIPLNTLPSPSPLAALPDKKDA